METKIFEIGSAPRIHFEKVGGSLRVRAQDTDTVEIQCDADLQAEAENGKLTVACEADCTMVVPLQATVEAVIIGGDVSCRGFSGEVSMRTVGGNISLRGVGAATVETVGGDVTARQLSGGLSVDRVGGDAIVDHVQGDVRLRSLGGDLRLSRVEGLVQVTAGGDARVSLSPQGESKSSVDIGGDLSCYLAQDASVRVRLEAGGDLRLAVPVEATETSGRTEIQLGEGKAEVDLSCGGDLTLRAGPDSEEVVAVDLGEAIAARVGAEIESHMIDIEEGLTGLGDRLLTFDAEKIGRKVRTTIAKAQRKAAKAQRKAARHRRTVASMKEFNIGTPSSRGVSEDERLLILQMLEKGKITVEETESLLGALES